VRKKIFPVFDTNAHFDHLSGRENLYLFMSLYGLPSVESADDIAARFELDLDQKVNEYSLGMRRKLSLTEAFLSGREVIFFDEPALGLDSSMRSALFLLVSEVVKQNVTVVFCTNRIDDTIYADRLWKMEKGRLEPAVSTGELRKSLLQVTISFRDHDDVTEYIPSSGELPDIIRKHLSLGIPRKIMVSGGEEQEIWAEEALRKIRRAPRALQNMISTLVEHHARESGYTRITEDVVDEVRRRFEQR
jgi:ABC-type multidrug transport system ATPase subunit